jgi:hypothetical protein
MLGQGSTPLLPALPPARADEGGGHGGQPRLLHFRHAVGREPRPLLHRPLIRTSSPVRVERGLCSDLPATLPTMALAHGGGARGAAVECSIRGRRRQGSNPHPSNVAVAGSRWKSCRLWTRIRFRLQLLGQLRVWAPVT